MPVRPTTARHFELSVSAISLCLLLAVLWLAGGASRPDVTGQVVVRAAVALLLVGWLVLGERPSFAHVKAPLVLLVLSIALPLVQLVPLPPALWQALPGRDLFIDAATLSGQSQPWRPLAIVPGAAANAAASLTVPLATLLFWAGMKDHERRWVPSVLLCLVAANAVVGLLQFSSGGMDYPFVNDTVGVVGGTFANRNHFALFMAFGCLLVPHWSTREAPRFSWRIPVAVGLVALFMLAVLAGGSRAGLFLVLIATALGIVVAWPSIRQTLGRAPRWATPALVMGMVSLLGVVILVSIAADRAQSIDRILADDAGQDMRTRALPTVLEAIRTYFPVGAGLGGFDPIFRIHEPFHLLKPTYFNHAHNDYLEIVLDAGVLGLALLIAGLGWWLLSSVKAWRAGGRGHDASAKTGSAILLLVIIASLFDYPARTPIMLSMVMLGALWLARGLRSGGAPLPVDHPHL